MSPCCLVCCMLSCQFADMPISHRAPMNPSGHWHWNAPRTLAHVPPFWHGLLLLLVHSSMSEKKKHKLGRFSLGFLRSVFLKSYLFRSIFLKEPFFPDTPNKWAPWRMVSQKIWPASNFGFQTDLQSHSRYAWRPLNFPVNFLSLRILHYLENKAKCSMKQPPQSYYRELNYVNHLYCHATLQPVLSLWQIINAGLRVIP